jgi:hypothetical protein
VDLSLAFAETGNADIEMLTIKALTNACNELLKSRIAEKNQRLRHYRFSTPEVWLLIVNNHFFGPGEVRARPEDIKAWRFVFDFEKAVHTHFSLDDLFLYDFREGAASREFITRGKRYGKKFCSAS